MANLHEKVLEIKTQNGHGIEEIRAFVNLEIKRLQELYKKESDIKSISDKYRSTSYKTFMVSGADKTASYFSELLKKCLLEESNINNFIKSGSKFIQHSSKDFFAIYCGYEGYNDFIDKNKMPRVEGKTNNNLIKDNEIGNLHEKLNNVPDLEIEKYISRISIVEQISNLFEQKNKKINITGISGNGKTFLARHFVQHYSEKFSHIIWLNCSEGLSKAFTEGKGAKLLDKIGLSAEHLSFVNGNMKVESLIDMLLGRLESIKENSILVLDNVNEEILFYENELNSLSDWKILTTSQESLQGFCNYAIPSFEGEALKLFYKYYTLESDNDNLIRLLLSVEYHTLTIELLAKTAQQRQITIIELVNRFIENGINVVEKVSIIADHNIERKNKVERKTKIENIEEYLNIVFDTSVLSEEECKILLNIAILQTEPIEINLFKEVYLNNKSDKKIVDVFMFNIDALLKKGWIQIEYNTLRLHNLVKKIILKRFILRTDFFHLAIKYLEEILDLELNTQVNLQKIDYLTFSESILENISEGTADIVSLQVVVASFYAEIGLYEKAKKIETNILNQLKKAERTSEKMINIMVHLHNLSCISIIQNKYEDALRYSLELYSLSDENVFSFIIDSLNYFFEKYRIDNVAEFENKFNLKDSIEMVDLILSSRSIIIMHEYNKKNLSQIIKELDEVLLQRQDILNIFEKYIPKKVLFSIEIYRSFLLNICGIYRSIGRHYHELKDFNKAEESYEKILTILKKLFTEEKDSSFSYLYHQLTILYLDSMNMDKAKYFLEKNGQICSSFPQNHPAVDLYNKDSVRFNRMLEQKRDSQNIEDTIQSKFDILFEKNKNSTSLVKYYHTLSHTYFEYAEYEKAIDYINKGIYTLLHSDDNVDYYILIYMYLQAGTYHCCLNDFDEALIIHTKVSILYKEIGINDEKINDEISKLGEVLMKFAVKSNNIPIISSFIKSDLAILEYRCNDTFRRLFPIKNILLVSQKLFDFLFKLPDLEESLNGVETTEEKMNLFLAEYNTFYQNILIKNIEHIHIETISGKQIQYKILNEYLSIIINIFLTNENYNISIQYYFKKLFLNLNYFEFVNVAYIYHEISCCYFNLRKFELAFENINKAIPIYSKTLENKNSGNKDIEEIKTFLKDALNLEKIILNELKKYKK